MGIMTVRLPLATTGGSLEVDEVIGARPLLEALPFPVFEIADDYAVRWINSAGRRAYGQDQGTCYGLSHGNDQPCHLSGEQCPKKAAEEGGTAQSVFHVHATHGGLGLDLFRVTAIPLARGGVVEMHVPLEDGVTRDKLTGLHARDFFHQLVDRQRALLTRLAQPYALVLIDLDAFKQLNDRHGHAAGDAALTAVGTKILGELRASDTAGRVGGEELAIFLPATDLAGAHTHALRLQAAIRAAELAAPWTAVRVTASFGVAAAAAPVPFADVRAAADRALYRAKAAGRDRIELADPA
jgi:diguanylate cyclase (GGDEF)-like protein